MAKKKKRKRRVRIPKTTKYEPETYEQQRKKFPGALVKAFLAVANNGWKDDKLYQKYSKEQKKYLGKLADDRIEQGKVTVLLARATFDLRETKKKSVKVVKKKKR